MTANLGCASPSADRGRRVAAAHAWADQARGRAVDLAFVQEVPTLVWLRGWRAAGYEYAVASPMYGSRSAVLWRTARVAGEPVELPAARYHGSYVSAARLDLPAGPLLVVSVHASAKPVSKGDLGIWQRHVSDLPAPRRGGGRDNGKLFDADLVLQSLVTAADKEAVLAAGDYHVSLGWDADRRERWAELYFAAARDAGLVPVLHDRWGTEYPTAFGQHVPRYQLDHVLASREVAEAIPAPPLPEPPDEADVADGLASDHAPIWFELRT
ncbi:MAG: hypothetical protein HOQ45_15020 [Nocardioidaceae bacterium]|nr:hypothetical protein [Nocardioidaceae bacterium]